MIIKTRTDSPLISIVVPCYNLEKYIVQCLNSIIKQSYKNWELIVVNDGSTDNSKKLICEVIDNSYHKIERVQGIRLINQSNAGASAARNMGIQNCIGDYIAFVDGDDWLIENYLERLVAGIKDSRDDLCISGLRYYNDESRKFGNQFVLKNCVLSGMEVFGKIDILDFHFCNVYCKLFRMDIIRKNNILFDDRLKVGEDLAFNLDFYKRIKNCVIIEDSSYIYRIRENSLIHQVTLPTKQKYVYEHCFHFFDDLDNEEIQRILQSNKWFCGAIWDFGILNLIQADAYMGERKNIRKVINAPLVEKIMRVYVPKTKKDKILYIFLKKKWIFLLSIVVKAKYKVLKTPAIYEFIKKHMIAE